MVQFIPCTQGAVEEELDWERLLAEILVRGMVKMVAVAVEDNFKNKKRHIGSTQCLTHGRSSLNICRKKQ